MDEPLRIRAATEADLPALIVLYRHLIAADTPCPEDLHRSFRAVPPLPRQRDPAG